MSDVDQTVAYAVSCRGQHYGRRDGWGLIHRVVEPFTEVIDFLVATPIWNYVISGRRVAADHVHACRNKTALAAYHRKKVVA